MSKKAKSFEEFYSKNKDDILDIDIVADCQIDKAVTDFLGILGQSADSL